MAILLKTKLPTGVIAEYWKIISYFEAVGRETASVEVALYTTAEDRHNNCEPVDRRVFQVPLDVVDTVTIEDAVYPYLQEHDLAGGQNV